MEALAHVGRMNELHEGLFVRAKAPGAGLDNGRRRTLGAVDEERLLTLQRDRFEASGFQLGLQRVPADVAGDVALPGSIQ